MNNQYDIHPVLSVILLFLTTILVILGLFFGVMADWVHEHSEISLAVCLLFLIILI